MNLVLSQRLQEAEKEGSKKKVRMGEICIVLRELAAVSILGTGNDLLVPCNALAC